MDQDAMMLAQAMMGQGRGMAQDPRMQPNPPQEQGLWQKILALLQGAGQPTTEGAMAIHDEALPGQLRIDPLLQQNKQKEALIDAMLRSAE
jgi:hypothetical protein